MNRTLLISPVLPGVDSAPIWHSISLWFCWNSETSCMMKFSIVFDWEMLSVSSLRLKYKKWEVILASYFLEWEASTFRCAGLQLSGDMRDYRVNFRVEAFALVEGGRFCKNLSWKGGRRMFVLIHSPIRTDAFYFCFKTTKRSSKQSLSARRMQSLICDSYFPLRPAEMVESTQQQSVKLR